MRRSQCAVAGIKDGRGLVQGWRMVFGLESDPCGWPARSWDLSPTAARSLILLMI